MTGMSLSEGEHVLGCDAPRVPQRAIRHTLATIALMNRHYPYPGCQDHEDEGRLAVSNN